jgi:hypothetical protein
MTKLLLGVGAGLVLALAVLGGMSLSKSDGQPVGAAAGPDVTSMTFFHDNVNIGGRTLATSSIGTATYTAANIANSRLIEHNAASALTVTLPTNAALSAIGFLPKAGDTQSLFIHASTTEITLAAGTGMTLESASSTLKVAANNTARLEFVRLGATEGRRIEVLLTQF